VETALRSLVENMNAMVQGKTVAIPIAIVSVIARGTFLLGLGSSCCTLDRSRRTGEECLPLQYELLHL
jgi:hypothetical protein